MSSLNPVQTTCLIIPCYNEADRFPVDEILNAASLNNYHICLVNDGSQDGTVELLSELADRSSSIHFLNLPDNVGKGEAVRQGVLWADQNGFYLVGFFDADLATPLSEIPQFLSSLQEKGMVAVIGSRMQRLGANVERHIVRHYLGRIFATVASVMLSLSVYDTQCGAKFFDLRQCKDIFHTPFSSKWFFDVELLFRLRNMGISARQMYEIPLTKWQDQGGSKLKLKDFILAPWELYRIYRIYR